MAILRAEERAAEKFEDVELRVFLDENPAQALWVVESVKCYSNSCPKTLACHGENS